ncbi:uncharacterized protein EI97DRAFT_375665 [Westerdykella ornata]|uniref:Uncharacterized protein n=1 Tax=Westerdykella ornata TaxID=318751 RepID=A0A6A6JM16_WESOR|nr:uncharacterized protein EI97DRAFT_375665 [Westerdykella ornata]KAF2277284.1 hypothetical protein EI97DRAFT_375665 [Westerdykella ornata]
MAPGTANPTKRKGPAFKPPRPVKAPVQSSTSTKPTTGAPSARSSAVAKNAASSRRTDAAPMVINSSEEEVDEDPFAGSDVDELMDEVAEDATDAIQSQPQLEPIPEKLLGRLLQEGFEDENTKIHRGAMELTAKYMDIFVREALSRAVHERREADKARGGQSGTVFLQVEDLEKLAPQLVLDF